MNKHIRRSGRWRATRAGSLVTLATAVVLLTAACGSSSDDKSGDAAGGDSGAKVSTVTLGEITDLSGTASVYGKPENQGAQIAVQEINAAGGIKSLGGAQLKLKTYDTQSSADQGTSQATAAVADKVSAIFGGEISDTVIAGTNVTQRAGIPWVNAGGTANEIFARGYDTVFTVNKDSDQYGGGWAEAIRLAASALGISNPKVVIAYSDTTYGQQLLDGFTKNASGMTIASKFSYPASTTDYSSVAARLASADADVIFNAGYPGDGIALGKLFASKFTPKAKVVIAGGSDATDVLTQLKDQANSLLALGDLTPESKGVPASFTTMYQAYQSKFGEIPNTQALAGYLAVRVIAQALEDAKSADAAKITTALKSVQLTAENGNIYPAPATISFASNGSLKEAPIYLSQITGGKQVLVYPDTVAGSQIVAYR
jgi:branched-chain amino acid transport system substrate-binding protein